MADTDWRRLEREASANPDDRELVLRAILARVRVGDVAPLALLERWLRPDIERYARELKAGAGPCDAPAAKVWLKAAPVEQVALVGFCFARLDLFLGSRRVSELLSRFLRRKTLPMRAVDLVRILDGARRSGGTTWPQPWSGILRQVELCVEREGVAAELRAALCALESARVEAFKGARERGVVVTRAKRLVGAGFGAIPRAVIQPGELWADDALAALSRLGAEERDAWTALLVHAASSKSGQPGERWLALARERIAAIGDSFAETACAWIGRVSANPDRYDEFGYPAFDFVAPANLPVLRGLAWSLGGCGPAVGTLSELAAYCYVKIPERGPRCQPLANACVTGLALGGAAAIPALEGLLASVAHASSRTAIERALARARGERLEPKARAKRPRPAPAPVVVPEPGDQPERDRELVEALSRLEGLRPMQRMFVADVQRTVVTLKGTLTPGQRREAQGLIENRGP